MSELFNWINFVGDSTVKSLSYIHKTRTLPCKFAWIVFVIAVFVAGLVMCYTSISQYTAYEVSTNLRIDTAAKPMTFPSVTFCVHQMFVTNSIYNSQPILQTLVNAWEKNKGGKTQKSCQNAPEKIPTMSTSDIKKLGSFMTFINKITLTFPKHLLGCWWRDEQFPCDNRTFTQHPTDVGNCFTFNMADVWKTRLGIEPREFWTNTTTPEGGLKLLINLVPRELCGVDEYYYKGIGVRYDVHSKDFPFMSLDMIHGFRKLPPGHISNVAVSVSHFDRQTEHMGKCTSRKLTSSDGLASQPYFYDMCYVRKFVVEVWKRCKCAFDVVDKIETFMTEENMGGVKINTSVSCFEYSRSQCAFNYVKVFFGELNQQDIDCPLPCQEKKYAVTVTHEKLTERLLMRHIQNLTQLSENYYSWPNSSSNETWWKRNVVLVNFYWQNDQIFVWVDVQAFKFVDLLIYLANVWFSFYGASFLGLFELVYFVVRRLHQGFHFRPSDGVAQAQRLDLSEKQFSCYSSLKF